MKFICYQDGGHDVRPPLAATYSGRVHRLTLASGRVIDSGNQVYAKGLLGLGTGARQKALLHRKNATE